MARFEREPSEFTEKLVALNRVSKTVKGGRIFMPCPCVRGRWPEGLPSRISCWRRRSSSVRAT